VPPRQRVYVDLEQSATLIRQYEFLAIPGLLQTLADAMALSEAIFPDAAAEEITGHVELRMTRQAREKPCPQSHQVSRTGRRGDDRFFQDSRPGAG
jgi:Domain of unknown function (DUF5753)